MKDPHEYPVGDWYQDGFCGGSEPPSERELDEMIYPERGAPPTFDYVFGETDDQRATRVMHAADQVERDHLREDRAFVITAGNPTNQAPGPPRMPRKE
jgi:hypothetical protein